VFYRRSSCCDSCVWIQEQVASVPDLPKIGDPICQRELVRNELTLFDPKEAYEQCEVLGLPVGVVTDHGVDGEVLQYAAVLKALENRALPVVKSIAKES